MTKVHAVLGLIFVVYGFVVTGRYVRPYGGQDRCERG